jgi:acyl carrier protein
MRDSHLDFFVLFSSTTALLGASGMAHYAAANAFLDATAVATDRPAKRVLSINWGTWEVMRLASAESQRSYREGGLEPMPAAEALDALGRLLASPGCAQSIVARVDWQTLKPLHEARRTRPFLERLGNEAVAQRHARPASVVEPAAVTVTLSERLREQPAERRHELLIAFLRAEVGTVLGIDPAAVTLESGLFEMGMDSLMSVELRKRIERGAGRKLPSTLTFNYPNVAALAGFLDREIGTQAPTAPAAGSDSASAGASPPAVVTPEGDIASLSDAELEARLLARLEAAR